MTHLHTQGGMPGFSDAIYSGENELRLLGNDGFTGVIEKPMLISGESRDAGNDPTTTLRGGTIMMERASDDLIVPYSATTPGKLVGILPRALSVIDSGVPMDRWHNIFIAGNIKHEEVIGGNRAVFARLAAIGFWFDHPAVQRAASFDQYDETQLISPTSLTLDANDHGRCFTAINGQTMTIALPATIQAGLSYEFKTWRLSAATAMTVTSAAGKMLDTGANPGASMAMTLGGQHVRVTGIDVSGVLYWEVSNFGIAAPVIT